MNKAYRKFLDDYEKDMKGQLPKAFQLEVSHLIDERQPTKVESMDTNVGNLVKYWQNRIRTMDKKLQENLVLPINGLNNRILQDLLNRKAMADEN